MNMTRAGLMTVCFIICYAFIPPKKKFIDPANMDLSVKPGDNFYKYANGSWLRKNPVPPSKTRWGSFDALRELSVQRVKSLLEEASVRAASDSSVRKIGDFYFSGMDSSRLEKIGYQPLIADFQRISNIKDVNGLLDEVAFQHSTVITNPLFGFSISQDRKNVAQYIPVLQQGGITLPDRDYYIQNIPRMKTIMDAYAKHIEKMFRLAGVSTEEASHNAEAIIKIETGLAKAENTRVEMRDAYKTYNKFSIKDLDDLTPSIDWEVEMKKHQFTRVDSIVVDNPGFFRAVDILLGAIPLEDWKAYLSWYILHNSAPYLSSAFVNEDFSFASLLTGQKVMTPRSQKISGLIDAKLGELVGRLYVDKYFKPAAKQRMVELVNNLQQTFANRIKKLDWMSEKTKTKGLEKLNAFTKKIAYPDKWKTYATVIINKNDLIGNIRNSDRWAYQEMVSRFGKPVDKTLWHMTPPTINAYYSPTGNEIVFPAGILQFPFYDFDADDAINYGGIAAVIGHEMTHGFDDNGSKYGPDGNLHDWWTDEDEAKFKTRTESVVQEYNALTVQDSIHVNGKLTLGENIADLGGLSMAYEAFTHTKQFKEGKAIDGFTPVQRFFLNFAQLWRYNILPEIEAQYILVDPHSPGIHRTNGTVVNLDPWYEAFNVKEGDKMFVPKDKRINVW